MSVNRKRIAPIIALVAIVGVIFAICAWYYTHDPAAGGAPRCTFKMLTGWDCPGCGAQRAFHALLHGRIADAWHYNPLLFLAVPTALFYIVVETGRSRWPKLHRAAANPPIIAAILIVTILYTILRNVL